MTETQLSFFDAPSAYNYERQQYETERDAFLLSHLGSKKTKRWHDKNTKIMTQLNEISSKPRSPELQAAIDAATARILAATKPLVDKYALLGVEQGATKRDIKNAYRRKARKVHPDVGGDAEAFKQLHETYRHLLALAKV